MFDVLIVDGSNWWNMLRAIGNPFLSCDPMFLSQLEGLLSQIMGREVRFSERIWVSNRVNRHRTNTLWLIKKVFPQLKRACWQLRFPPTDASLKKPDDELVKWLLRSYAEWLPEGSLIGLGSGDGDFEETLRDIKSAYPHLELAVITTSFIPISYGSFHANPALKALPEIHFVDLLLLPCLRHLLISSREALGTPAAPMKFGRR